MAVQITGCYVEVGEKYIIKKVAATNPFLDFSVGDTVYLYDTLDNSTTLYIASEGYLISGSIWGINAAGSEVMTYGDGVSSEYASEFITALPSGTVGGFTDYVYQQSSGPTSWNVKAFADFLSRYLDDSFVLFATDEVCGNVMALPRPTPPFYHESTNLSAVWLLPLQSYDGLIGHDDLLLSDTVLTDEDNLYYNQLLSLHCPVRPHVPLPLPDGKTYLTFEDKYQLLGLYPWPVIPIGAASDYYLTQNTGLLCKIIVSDIMNGQEIDISSWVINYGSIKRAIEYDIGKMIPGQHSFTIMDSKAYGDFLFYKGKELSEEYWINKEVNVYIGYYDNEHKETWIHLYNGKITEKTEDRITGSISVKSNDVIKDLNNVKYPAVVSADEIFKYNDTTLEDFRGVQHVIAFGVHKMITNGSDKEKTTRNKPFSCVEAVSNQFSGAYPYNYTSGTIGTFDKYRLWYVPVQNLVNFGSAVADPYGTGVLNFYFWDYVAKKWTAFAASDITGYGLSRPVKYVYAYTGSLFTPYGFYIYINESSTTVDMGGNFASWADYITTSNDNFDPAICVEINSLCDYTPVDMAVNGNSANPVSVLYDLLTHERFLDLSSDYVDKFSFDNPQIQQYTWDKAYKYFHLNNAKINVWFDKPNSLMQIINAISETIGTGFYCERDYDDATSRKIKLLENSPISYLVYPLRENDLVYSTNDKISEFTVNINNDNLKNIVACVNFDTAISKKDFFDIKSYAETSIDGVDRELVLGGGSNPPVYFYDSGTAALACASRYFESLRNAYETIDISLGKAGLNIVVGMLIKLHDAITDETFTVQVYESEVNVKTGQVRLACKRFPYRFGPDEQIPEKLWGFWAEETTKQILSYWSDSPTVPPSGGGVNGETYHWF